jgi:hypothetical protein
LSSNFFGPGAKPGTVPEDLDHATGIERAELLAKLEGKELFDLSPLKITAFGTKSEPVMVKSEDPIRYVGCTGTSSPFLFLLFQILKHNKHKLLKSLK